MTPTSADRLEASWQHNLKPLFIGLGLTMLGYLDIQVIALFDLTRFYNELLFLCLPFASRGWLKFVSCARSGFESRLRRSSASRPRCVQWPQVRDCLL